MSEKGWKEGENEIKMENVREGGKVDGGRTEGRDGGRRKGMGEGGKKASNKKKGLSRE